jgi:hypothetical protein
VASSRRCRLATFVPTISPRSLRYLALAFEHHFPLEYRDGAQPREDQLAADAAGIERGSRDQDLDLWRPRSFATRANLAAGPQLFCSGVGLDCQGWLEGFGPLADRRRASRSSILLRPADVSGTRRIGNNLAIQP